MKLSLINRFKVLFGRRDIMWYTVIKNYYLKGIYTEANLIVFVTAGMITEEQMQEIIASKEVAE